MKVFVGNLSGETTEDDLRQAFKSFGQVGSITVVRDGITGESRGFGFITMASVNEAQTAIEKMNGQDLRGKKIRVEKGRKKTKARASRRRRSSFGTRSHADEGRKGDSGSRRGIRHH